MEWFKLADEYTPDINREVLGFNKEWIDPDYNEDGIRLCFMDDDGNWTSAAWCGKCDEYHSLQSNDLNFTNQKNIAPTHWKIKPANPLMEDLGLIG